MEASETRLWDMCAKNHKDLGTIVYRRYLAKRIERYENMSASASHLKLNNTSFCANRRLIAILVQERMMLDMEDAELKTVGFDGAFIALGRSYVPNFLQAYLAFDLTIVQHAYHGF